MQDASAAPSALTSAPTRAPIAAPANSPRAVATAEAPAPADSIIVRRPEHGLARGIWEAPPWALVTVAMLTLLLFGVFFGRGYITNWRNRWRSKR